MAKKDINSKDDATTKDMQPEQAQSLRSWTIPGLGVTVKAHTMQEALETAKEVIRKEHKKK